MEGHKISHDGTNLWKDTFVRVADTWTFTVYVREVLLFAGFPKIASLMTQSSSCAFCCRLQCLCISACFSNFSAWMKKYIFSLNSPSHKFWSSQPDHPYSISINSSVIVNTVSAGIWGHHWRSTDHIYDMRKLKPWSLNVLVSSSCRHSSSILLTTAVAGRPAAADVAAARHHCSCPCTGSQYLLHQVQSSDTYRLVTSSAPEHPDPGLESLCPTEFCQQFGSYTTPNKDKSTLTIFKTLRKMQRLCTKRKSLLFPVWVMCQMLLPNDQWRCWIKSVTTSMIRRSRGCWHRRNEEVVPVQFWSYIHTKCSKYT